MPAAIATTASRNPVHESAEQVEAAESALDAESKSGWQLRLAAWIKAYKAYPPLAQQRGEQGAVTLEFEVLPTGHVSQVHLVRSSGSVTLERAGIDLLTNATLPAFTPIAVSGSFAPARDMMPAWRIPMLSPVIRFRIDFAKHSYVGPGKIDLLEAIRSSGSLSQAARDLKMSYRRAWLLVESLNTSFRKPVTIATTGGKGGGGVEMTQFGEELIDSYRALERDIVAAAVCRLHTITPAAHSRPAAAAPRRALSRKRRAAI